MRNLLRLCAILMLAFLAQTQAHAQSPARRVALVIGESAYRTVSPLANPAADARLVSDSLAKAGFDVRLGLDLDKAALELALEDFARDAQTADVAAVYFAGHGFENGGSNWLVPIDATIRNAADVQTAAVPFQAVARSLNGAKVKIVALDACRDNPFAARAAEGGVINRGLAEVELDGYVVIYAASVGQVALDGGGANSPFAQAYARRVSESNVDLRLLAGRIRDDVAATTGGQQRPFVSASLSGEEIVLAPAPVGRVRGAATTRERPSAYFEFVRRVSDHDCFQTQTVKCVTQAFGLSGSRLYTIDDDGKMRIWDAMGASLQRTEAMPEYERRAFGAAAGAMAFSGAEESRIGVHTPVDVVPVQGARTRGSVTHGSDEPVLRAVATPLVGVYSYDWCTIGMMDLRTFRSIGEVVWPANCGGGITVNWLFADDATDRVLASVKQGDRWATLVMSARAARTLCEVQGRAPDAAFNDAGGFHVANTTGGIVTYDGQCRQLRTDQLHRAEIKGVYPFDATRMMSDSVDGVVKVWSVARGVVERELTGLPRGASIQYVRGDRGVLILSEDKHLYVWQGEPRLGAYVGPSANVCGGMLSEDGATIYARRCDGVVEVWRRKS